MSADQLAIAQHYDTNHDGIIDKAEWLTLLNVYQLSKDATTGEVPTITNDRIGTPLCSFPATGGTQNPSPSTNTCTTTPDCKVSGQVCQNNTCVTPPADNSCTTDACCVSKNAAGWTYTNGTCTAPSGPTLVTAGCDALVAQELKLAQATDTNGNGRIDGQEWQDFQSNYNQGIPFAGIIVSPSDKENINRIYLKQCPLTPGSGTSSPGTPGGGTPGPPPTGNINGWQCTSSSTQAQCQQGSVTAIDTEPNGDLSKKGRVYIDGTSVGADDRCLSDTVVQKYSLNPVGTASNANSIFSAANVNCPAGTVCKDGACSQAAAAASGTLTVTAPTGGSFSVASAMTISWTGSIPGITNVYIRLYKGTPPSTSQRDWLNNPLFSFNSGNAVDIGSGAFATTTPKNGDNGSALAAGTDYFIAVGYGGQLVAFSPNFSITTGPASVTGPLKADFTCTYNQAFFATDGSVLPKTIQCTDANPAAAWDWTVSGAAVADPPLNQASVLLRPTDNASANILVVLRAFRNADKSIGDQSKDEAFATQVITLTRNVAPGTGPSQNSGTSGQAPSIQQFFVVEDQANRLQYRSISFIVQACDPNGAVLANHIDYGDGTTDDFAETSCLAVARIHQYNQSGALKATLLAKSASGGKAQQDLPITILANPGGGTQTGRPPIINSFQVAANSSQIVGGLAMFSYDICDPDSNRLTLDFNYGDGQVDTGLPHICGQGLRAHVYTQPGLYSVTVTAQDSQSGRAGAATSISIQPANPHQGDLAAQFNWSPVNPNAGNAVVFYGGLSQDPSGTIASYAWDFTNGGVFSLISPSPVATYTFSQNGTYPVRLRVIDNQQSQSAEVTHTVVVGPARSTSNILNVGDLVRTAVSDHIYQIVAGASQGSLLKHWLPTAAVFLSYGFNWNDVKTVSPGVLDPVPRVKLVKLANNSTIYYVTEPGRKRAIPNQTIFQSYGNSFGEVFTVNQTELDAYLPNTLIHLEHDPRIYRLEKGQKRWIKNWSTFVRLGYQWSDVAPVNQTELDSYPTGSSIN